MRRPRASVFLLATGVTLLIAIVIGEKMGDRVLHQGTQSAVLPDAIRASASPGVIPSGGLVRDWKKVQIVTIATDPGFPDPRVTPTPSPTPTPRRTPTPSPVPTLAPVPTLPPETEPPLPSGTPSPDARPPGR